MPTKKKNFLQTQFSLNSVRKIYEDQISPIACANKNTRGIFKGHSRYCHMHDIENEGRRYKFRLAPFFNTMDYFLELYRNRVFLIKENELKVFEIDPDEIKVLRTITLEIPGFYKKMPSDFYLFKEPPAADMEFVKTIENWKASYSSITGMAVESGYLAVQMRTCSDKLKKYVLLFYNVNTFKLENTFFTNDFFYGASNGKYYFYANGNPGYDEEAEECIINLYSFKEGEK